MEQVSSPSSWLPIVHVCLVDFHHRRGPVVEHAVPAPPRGWRVSLRPVRSSSSTRGVSAQDGGAGDATRVEDDGGCQEVDLVAADPGDREDSACLNDYWTYLPFLALPDGLHKFEEEGTFFTFRLPLDNDCATRATNTGSTSSNGAADCTRFVYGVSCCRQIGSGLLQNAGSNVVRNTVMKGIVVLMSIPAFELVYHAVEPTVKVLFEQKDFSKNDLLEGLYASLNR